MEERRKSNDEFLEKIFKLEAAVQRLTEHEALDRPRYEERYKEVTGRLVELEKMRREIEVTTVHEQAYAESEKAIRARVDALVNGKLTALDERQRKMERTFWRASGAATVIASLLVFLVNIITKHL